MQTQELIRRAIRMGSTGAHFVMRGASGLVSGVLVAKEHGPVSHRCGPGQVLLQECLYQRLQRIPIHHILLATIILISSARLAPSDSMFSIFVDIRSDSSLSNEVRLILMFNAAMIIDE